MRIMGTPFNFQNLVVRNPLLRHGNRRLLAGEVVKDLSHLPFQVPTGIQHHVGVAHQAQIAGRRFVEMRIDSRPHEGFDFHMCPANVASQIGDHSRGADNFDGMLAAEFVRRIGRFRMFLTRG